MQHHRRGLTLMEALVVITIIALLAALLFPVLSSSRAATRRADCRSHLRQIGMAYQMYAADHGSYPGPHALVTSPYISDQRILVCPQDTSLVLIGARSSYTYRHTLPPDFRLIDSQSALDPNVVLTNCDHHLDQKVTVKPGDRLERSPPTYPFHLVLRASGGVRQVSVDSLRTLSRRDVDGRIRYMHVFPGEPGYAEAGK